MSRLKLFIYAHGLCNNEKQDYHEKDLTIQVGEFESSPHTKMIRFPDTVTITQRYHMVFAIMKNRTIMKKILPY